MISTLAGIIIIVSSTNQRMCFIYRCMYVSTQLEVCLHEQTQIISNAACREYRQSAIASYLLPYFLQRSLSLLNYFRTQVCYRIFEELSQLMSEENNWKIYRAEQHETMFKGTCMRLLGQFLTQILHQEAVKEMMSYQGKSQECRPQSIDLSADNQQTLSAPTTPVNSVYNDMNNFSEAVFLIDLNLDYNEQRLYLF